MFRVQRIFSGGIVEIDLSSETSVRLWMGKQAEHEIGYDAGGRV